MIINFYQLIKIIKMSKRRDFRKNTGTNFNMNASLDDRKLKKSSSFFGYNHNESTIKSRFIPDLKRYTSGEDHLNLNDFRKERLFNKNISYYRQSFNQNDSSQLPFMSSLRRGAKMSKIDKNQSTISQPFSAGEKTTSNMKIKKSTKDLFGKSIRLTNSYYRWHNNSGVNNKQVTAFQCSLRDYNKNWDTNPEESCFNNVIKPIRYQDVEGKVYGHDEVICPRQKKILKLEAIRRNR